MDELAKLVASIPGVKGTATIPYSKMTLIENETKTTFYNLCKGKHRLVEGEDDEKIEKYILEFEKLVERYQM